MPTTVDLQKPLSFSLVLTVILIVLAVLPPLIWLIIKLAGIKLPERKQKKEALEAPKEIKPVRPIAELKRDYMRRIDEIEAKYNNQEIDARETHIRMSSVVRGFVNEATGVNVRNYTLQEIARLNMPDLAKLIEEFYSPEFAFGTEDVKIEDSFGNARQVIREWN